MFVTAPHNIAYPTTCRLYLLLLPYRVGTLQSTYGPSLTEFEQSMFFLLHCFSLFLHYNLSFMLSLSLQLHCPAIFVAINYITSCLFLAL